MHFVHANNYYATESNLDEETDEEYTLPVQANITFGNSSAEVNATGNANRDRFEGRLAWATISTVMVVLLSCLAVYRVAVIVHRLCFHKQEAVAEVRIVAAVAAIPLPAVVPRVTEIDDPVPTYSEASGLPTYESVIAQIRKERELHDLQSNKMAVK